MNSLQPKLVRSGRAGGTLLDVVVVIAIVGVLVSLSVPMLLAARDRSDRYRCSEHLRQIGQAVRNYAHDYGRLPCTRPSRGPVVIPDVTNSGFAAADPFGPDGPRPNNVPAVLFLLLRTGQLKPDALICPATDGSPDHFGGLIPGRRSNFTDLQANLTYSFQNPYASDSALAKGFRWAMQLPASFVIAADRNPGDAAAISPESPPNALRSANSNSHGKRGQNVLYADGRVEFETTPFVGTDKDNIYASRNNKTLDSPQDAADSVLLPADGPVNPIK